MKSWEFLIFSEIPNFFQDLSQKFREKCTLNRLIL